LYWKWETSQTPTTLTAGSGSSMCESRIPDFSSGAGSCDARRQPCRAELTYGDIGAHAGRFTIDGRWVSLPEPVQQVPGGRAVLDVGAVFSRPREVVTANDAVLLDVAIKQDGVTDCFAFNNRSYLFPPNWSNPAWALSSATYWVSVRIVAAEIEEVRVFYLVNQGNQRNGLRLEPTVPR